MTNHQTKLTKLRLNLSSSPWLMALLSTRCYWPRPWAKDVRHRAPLAAQHAHLRAEVTHTLAPWHFPAIRWARGSKQASFSHPVNQSTTAPSGGIPLGLHQRTCRVYSASRMSPAWPSAVSTTCVQQAFSRQMTTPRRHA